MFTTKRLIAKRLLVVTAIAAFAVTACGDDSGNGGFAALEDVPGPSDEQNTTDPAAPDNRLDDVSSLDDLSDDDIAKLKELLAETPGFGEPPVDGETPLPPQGDGSGSTPGTPDNTDAGESTDPGGNTGTALSPFPGADQPGRPPARMCDVISADEASTILGQTVTTSVAPKDPKYECIFDVNGQAIASVQVYHGDASVEPKAFLEQQNAGVQWDHKTERPEWGEAAEFGSINGGTHGAIALTQRRSDSVVLLFMWLAGEPNASMLDKGAAVAHLVLPRV